ncbi:stearoyl-CoA desaturase (delta-9 desaturase) [Tahibacter aquaticus]|uniref:Stearoyl-CoA desaturase (Delta-9 desaturase) n=1 Tax=Tahibacter aquaticus TaxID=520092 RepID=A0A4R6YI21_9GAMM|nr:fatty acid desaturase [Tahibacter aquaticus]TDR36266.1 stearoyl-CoA desaturase (delta-9 desaturase) [Tahibacter aquaticus]
MFNAATEFLTGGLLQADWPWLVAYFVLVTQLTIFSVTLYLHRSQAHRGVDFHPVLNHFFRFWTWFSTAMVTKEWVAIHRKHHAKCETEEDPHSPVIYGIKKVLWDGVDLYRQARRQSETMDKYGLGTPNDWIERRVYTPYPEVGPTLMLFLSFALFGLWGVVIWACQMIWIPFWAAGVVNGLGHWWGYRNFESNDTATNLTPWGVIIGGEELHNNHHAFPSSSKFALRKWELDIGWVAIKSFEFFGLAKVLRVAPSLDVRPNMHLPDGDTIKALIAHKFQVMTDYFGNVIAPTLREEAAQAGNNLKDLPRRLRRALSSGGRWLDNDARERLGQWVNQRPTMATVMEYRGRLHELMESRNGEAMLEGLKQWCREAEASGIRALQEFAARLKGYSLVGAH